MKTRYLTRTLWFGLGLVSAGCYTRISVNFGNGTAETLRVQSSENRLGKTVKPRLFRELSNGSGDLTVTKQDGEQLRFQRVAPFDVERKYLASGRTPFGPNWVKLTVLLDADGSIYVLMPGKRSLDRAAPQPSGYPKQGVKLK